MGCSSICRHAKFQICLFIVGFVAGLGAFIGYLFYGILDASIFGGISAIYSGFLALEILKFHNIKDGALILPLMESQTTYIFKVVVSSLGIFISAAGMTYYMIRGFLRHEDASGDSWLVVVQCWMTFKWSLSWIFHLYHYHLPSSELLISPFYRNTLQTT